MVPSWWKNVIELIRELILVSPSINLVHGGCNPFQGTAIKHFLLQSFPHCIISFTNVGQTWMPSLVLCTLAVAYKSRLESLDVELVPKVLWMQTFSPFVRHLQIDPGGGLQLLQQVRILPIRITLLLLFSSSLLRQPIFCNWRLTHIVPRDYLPVKGTFLPVPSLAKLAIWQRSTARPFNWLKFTYNEAILFFDIV